MDAFSIVLYILLIVLISILVIGAYTLLLYVWKYIDHGWFAICGLQPVWIKDTVASTYAGLDHRISYTSLGMFPTADDPKLKNLAAQISAKGGSRKHKARVALALVQQYVRYVSDSIEYGKRDRWVLPWQVIRNRKGDCEDSAFLYAGLLYNMGIPSIVVSVKGHMTVGVDLGGKGACIGKKGFTYGNTFYVLAEPVSILPLFGMFPVSGTAALYAGKTEVPTSEWRNELESIQN